MSKLAEANKVAKVVLFPLSDDASDINGTEITVDTGSSAKQRKNLQVSQIWE